MFHTIKYATTHMSLHVAQWFVHVPSMRFCTFNELADQLVNVCDTGSLFDLLKGLLIGLGAEGEGTKGGRGEQGGRGQREEERSRVGGDKGRKRGVERRGRVCDNK